MKKRHTGIILQAAFALLLPHFLPAENFSITKTKGKNSAGASQNAYAEAEEGKTYALGTWLKTEGRSSSMTIEFDPRYIVLLRPKSEVLISGTGELNERFQRIMDLKIGSVALDLEKLPQGGKIRVETATAIGGAVGTEFSVDADTGEFEITEGSIEAKTKNDSIFNASSVSGKFYLKPGLENSYASAEHIEGEFTLNNQKIAGKSFKLAKASGEGGDAALVINGQRMLMKKGVLMNVSDGLAGTHKGYLKASSEEGTLFAKRENLKAIGQDTAELEIELQTAAKKATKLRMKLFQRDVARDAAKAGARAARDAMRR